MTQTLTAASAKPSVWQRLQDPKSLLFSLAPRGWNQQNMVVVARLEQLFLDGIDPVRQVLSPRRLDRPFRELESTFRRINPQNFLAAICVPNFYRACQTLARNQTLVNEAALACALERYRLAYGSLPDKLEALVLGFADKLPTDPINGHAFHYRRTGTNGFLLYSVGWDEVDGGGAAFRDKNGNTELARGDWPWEPDEQW